MFIFNHLNYYSIIHFNLLIVLLQHPAVGYLFIIIFHLFHLIHLIQIKNYLFLMLFQNIMF